MKKYFLRIVAIICSVLMVITSLSTSSCKKKDKTCVGEITVNDSTKLPMSGLGVTVTFLKDTSSLYKDPVKHGAIVDFYGTTDASGYVKFEFKLPGVYNVIVKHPTIPGKIAKGLLIMKEPGDKDALYLEF